MLGITSAIESVSGIANKLVDRFLPASMSEAEKTQAKIQIQEMLDKRETDLINVQRDIIVSEMDQKDKFTKRARPTVVYSGLAMIALVHVILPILAFILDKPMPELQLPEEFWMTWGSICAVWFVGRTAEKRGSTSNLINTIIGK